MTTHIIVNCIIAVGCALFACFPFTKRNSYVAWGKVFCGVIALLGMVLGLVPVAWDLGWLTLNNESGRRLDTALSFGRGLVLGLVAALVISGQLVTKKEVGQKRERPNQPPEPTAMSVTPPAAQEPRQP